MEEKKNKGSSLFSFIRKANLEWKLVIPALILSLGYSRILALIPNASAQVFAGDFTSAALGKMFLYVLLAAVLLAGTELLEVAAEAYSLTNLRKVIWKAMLSMRKSDETIYGEEKLVSSVTVDAEEAVVSIVKFFTTFFAAILLIAEAIRETSVLHGQLLWGIAMLVPFHLAYAIFLGRWQKKTNSRILVRIGGLTGYLAERLRNLALIRAFSAQDKEIEEGRKAIRELHDAKLQETYIATVEAAYEYAAEVIAVVAAVLLGSHLMKTGSITREAWMTFFLLMPIVNEEMFALAEVWVKLKGMSGCAERLIRILDSEKEEKPSQTKAFENGDIELKNVVVTYGEHTALDGLTLRIPAGKVTMVIGKSGTGKTSLLNLIARTLLPEKGALSVNGTDASEIRLHDYREHVSYALQGDAMFRGTVKDVILYGIEEKPEDAELLDMMDEIGLSKECQLEEKVAFEGRSLSASDKRKISVLRAVLHESDILLLDEPDAGLSEYDAEALMGFVRGHTQGKTVVIVTHDRDLIAPEDNLILMEKPSVQEQEAAA